MEKIPVFSWKRLPTKYPTLLTFVAWMAMDYYGAVGWVRGMVLTLLALFWVLAIARTIQQEQIDPFDEGAASAPSKWQKRMRGIQDKQAAARTTT